MQFPLILFSSPFFPSFTQFFFEFVPIALLVATIHIIFVSLLYMASHFFSNENLLAFSKHELAQAVYSLIIVGSVIAGIAMMNNLFCLALQENTLYNGVCTSDIGLTAHVKVARAHLAEMYNNVRVLAKGTLRAFDWSSTAAGTSTSVGLLQGRPMAWAGFHSFVFGESFSILYKVLLFIKFQELFLIINAAYFFPAFFNMGLVFRILPFTRKLGGLLMGITLGLFFVLPYMYILSQVVITSAEHFSTRFMLDTAKWQFTFMTFGSIMDSSGTSKDFDEVLEDMREKGAGTNAFGMAITELNKQNVPELNMGTAAAIPNPRDNAAFGTAKEYYDPHDPDNHNYTLVEVVARVILAVTFSSVFSLVGTISAIREISALFGGDVEIAGLTRLI